MLSSTTLLAFTATLLTAVAGPRVLVVKSGDLRAYASVLAGFTSEVRATVAELTLDENGSRSDLAFKTPGFEKPALVLAVGPAAANAVKRHLGDVPMIFCMVPYHEKYGLDSANATGIALTTNASRELALLRAVAPRVRRLGVLHDPRHSARQILDLQVQAQERGFTVVPFELADPGRVDKALKEGARPVDAFLMVADKTVAQAPVVRRLIAYSLEVGVPLVALSPTQVKEGALLSVSSSPVSVGQQAGLLANRILFEKVNPAALEIAAPDSLELAFNLSTAKHVGLSAAEALSLLEAAATNHYSVRVYE